MPVAARFRDCLDIVDASIIPTAANSGQDKARLHRGHACRAPLVEKIPCYAEAGGNPTASFRRGCPALATHSQQRAVAQHEVMPQRHGR
jgi:hypothetical protein